MTSFPPPPTASIDWAHVGFKVHEVNGHIESKYNKADGQWSEPKFVRDPFMRLHGMAPGLNYGQSCFEGIKAFRSPSGAITIFRPDTNAARMAHSASVISMPPIPSEHFLKCLHLAVGLNAEYVPPANTGAAMYIRPLQFGSSAQLGLNPPLEYTFAVYVMPTGVYHGVHAVDALILEDFDRAAPEGVGHAKVGGNYAPVLKHSEKARDQGFGITLHLDSKTRTEIDEFSTSGFIGVKRVSGSGIGRGEVALIVPDSKQIIKSTTSDSVCQIAQALLGWNVEKRRVTFEELSSFEEVMAAGTAAALVPIKSITSPASNHKFEYKTGGDGTEPGQACTLLLKTLQGIQQGLQDDPFKWCHKVEQPQDYADDGPEGANGVSAKNVDELL